MSLNIGALLTKRALLNPDKVGLVYGDLRLTYRELTERANRIANAMTGLGIESGDRVAILMRNAPPYIDLYFGLAKLGAITVCINWRLSPSEVDYILSDSGARLLVYDPDFQSTVNSLGARRFLEGVITLGSPSAPGEIAYDELLLGGDTEEPPAGADGNDRMLLVYTSGTTGRPKGATLTHEQMFWASATVNFTLDHRLDDVNLLVMPMYHIGGLAITTVYIHRGATIVLLPTWDSHKVLSVIQGEQVNHFMAVPTMLHSLLQHPDIDNFDLTCLRWVLVAAAPAPPALIRAYADRGILVQQTYGLTEVAGPATVISADQALIKAGSVGLPFFHTELRVVNEEGREVAPGQLGEVQIRGPHVISEYWRKPEATKAAFRDGWFLTGDLAQVDEEGHIYIVDRKKDLIISGGENIYPIEIENVLYEHPNIEDVAVVGMADETWGEIVCAIVVLRQGEALTVEEVSTFCEGRIASYKIPRELIIWSDPLPRNATGKILKHQLREHLHS